MSAAGSASPGPAEVAIDAAIAGRRQAPLAGWSLGDLPAGRVDHDRSRFGRAAGRPGPRVRPSSQAGGAARSARLRAIVVSLALARVDQRAGHVATAGQVAAEGCEPAPPGSQVGNHAGVVSASGLVRRLDGLATRARPGRPRRRADRPDRSSRGGRLRRAPDEVPSLPAEIQAASSSGSGSPIATGVLRVLLRRQDPRARRHRRAVRTSRPSAGCSAAPASAPQAERRRRTARVAAARRPGRLAGVASGMPIGGSVPPPGGSLHLETPEVAGVADSGRELHEHLDGPGARSRRGEGRRCRCPRRGTRRRRDPRRPAGT